MWGRRGRVTRLKQFGTRGVNNRKRRFWVVSCRKKSSLRRSRGEGDRRRRRWWRGGDLASSPLRQSFTLTPPHGFATGRVSGRNWTKELGRASCRERGCRYVAISVGTCNNEIKNSFSSSLY